MSNSDLGKYLETFPAWLGSLGTDAEQLGAFLQEKDVPIAPRQAIAGGLNYLFKSLDLIPDGIDDIGFLDDAFVLRVVCDLALKEDTGEVSQSALDTLNRLGNEADVIRDFLGKDYARLESYVRGLRRGAARGRSVDDILGDESVKAEFLADVGGFTSSYQPPNFSKEEKTLIKLRAFFDAKLPR